MTDEDEIRHRGPPGAGKRPIREPALAAGRGAESEDRPQTQALGTALPSILAKLYEKVGLQHRAAPGYDRKNRFFQEDFDELKKAGYLLMAVPEDLGGLGLSLAEVCRQTRKRAYHAPATALGINHARRGAPVRGRLQTPRAQRRENFVRSELRAWLDPHVRQSVAAHQLDVQVVELRAVDLDVHFPGSTNYQ
jgi:alkylation response protein AidB-like acyl-CoA dehydrogenase